MKITASSYRRMPEALWRRLRKLLPMPRPHPRGGRPPLDPRRVADGIYFALRTACPWKAVPREFGSGSSLHRYFQEWTKLGVFRRLWQAGLCEYDRRRGISWRWSSLDTTLTKAPLGGEKNRTQSHGSCEVGCQAVGAGRRSRRGGRFGGGTGQLSRPEIGCAHAGEHPGASSPAAAASAAARVRRQGVSCGGLSPLVGASPLPGSYPGAWRGVPAATTSAPRQTAALGQ